MTPIVKKLGLNPGMGAFVFRAPSGHKFACAIARRRCSFRESGQRPRICPVLCQNEIRDHAICSEPGLHGRRHQPLAA